MFVFCVDFRSFCDKVVNHEAMAEIGSVVQRLPSFKILFSRRTVGGRWAGNHLLKYVTTDKYWNPSPFAPPLAPLTHSLHSLIHFLRTARFARALRSLVRSLAHSGARGKVIFVYELNASVSYNFSPLCALFHFSYHVDVNAIFLDESLHVVHFAIF